MAFSIQFLSICVREAEQAVREAVTDQLSDVRDRIFAGEKLSDEDRKAILRVARAAVQGMEEGEERGEGEQGEERLG